MNEKLKQCPFCGGEAELCYSEVDTFCRKCNVMQETELWNTRPIEDALRLRIAELEAENERLSQLLHDEMSQLEIATDLGNKRWTALNKIYQYGEKHNTNWCKRIAQEGLGIKNA
jgi:hypothetical protein